MSKATFSKSHATSKRYIVGQVRVKELDGRPVFHVQVTGPVGNRDYGYATDVEVTKENAMLGLAFALSPTSKKSLAKTDKNYWVAQFRNRSNGTVNMQTKDIPPFAGNRKYGNALVFTDQGFSTWLSDTISQ